MKTRFAFLVAAWMLAGCSQQASISQPPTAVVVEVIAAGPGPVSGMVYSGVAQPAAQVPLAFRGPGYVSEVRKVPAKDGGIRTVGEGDRVRRGDVLARLRESEYRDRVNQVTGQVSAARAAAQRAKQEHERATRLLATQSITRPDFEAARAQREATEAQLATAEAALEEARLALRDTVLASPIDGDIVKKAVEPGALVGPGMPVFVVADLSAVKVVLGVPDVSLHCIAVGQPVLVSSDALPGRRFRATLTRIASAADPGTRDFDVEVEIPNPDRLWSAGMIASVELERGSQPSGLPRLPLSSFLEPLGERNRFAVMVVEGEGSSARARMRRVELGEVVGNRIEVKAGLAAGERVIATAPSFVADGERVEVVPAEGR